MEMATGLGLKLGWGQRIETGMGTKKGWRWGWGQRTDGDGDRDDGDRDRDRDGDREGAHPRAGRYFVWRFLVLSSSLDFWQEPYHWPLLIYLLLVCLYPFASSCAHTFSSMSARARHICYFCDYGALSLYSLGEPRPGAGAGPGTGSRWPRHAALLSQAAPSPTAPTRCRSPGSAAVCTVTLSPRLL